MPLPMSNCTYINTFIPYIACIWWWMFMAGILFIVKNPVTAHCLNCISSQASILTGTDSELWAAVGSRLHMVEGRYHMTGWNMFYPASITLIKKYDWRQNFSSHPCMTTWANLSPLYILQIKNGLCFLYGYHCIFSDFSKVVDIIIS